MTAGRENEPKRQTLFLRTDRVEWQGAVQATDAVAWVQRGWIDDRTEASADRITWMSPALYPMLALAWGRAAEIRRCAGSIVPAAGEGEATSDRRSTGSTSPTRATPLPVPASSAPPPPEPPRARESGPTCPKCRRTWGPGWSTCWHNGCDHSDSWWGSSSESASSAPAGAGWIVLIVALFLVSKCS